VWVLFAEDIRVPAFSRPDAYDLDTIFRSVSLVVAAIFAAELLLRSVVQPNYIFSFFFWLDVVAVGSIVPDVLPIFDSKDGAEKGKSRLRVPPRRPRRQRCHTPPCAHPDPHIFPPLGMPR
jgi:hypothetical protein